MIHENEFVYSSFCLLFPVLGMEVALSKGSFGFLIFMNGLFLRITFCTPRCVFQQRHTFSPRQILLEDKKTEQFACGTSAKAVRHGIKYQHLNHHRISS